MLRFILALSLIHIVAGQCNQNDRLIGDLCYSVSTQKVSAENAGSLCLLYNQYLAVIHTTLQANFLACKFFSSFLIHSFIPKITAIVRSQTGADKFWIGLRRASLNSRFQWSDGTTMTWSNFDSSLPKNDYYVAESTTNGKWQTVNGGQQLYYVCSYTPGSVTGIPVSYPPSETPAVSYPPSGAPVSYPASGAPVSYPPTGVPVSYPASEGPVSYPPSGAPVSYQPTGEPVSYPASGAPVSYPASGAPVSYPPSGAPVSYPASGAPVSYPASEMPVSYPASGAPVSYPASGAPVSYPASGAPVSYPPSGAPVSYPASGAPVSYPASGAPVSYPAYTPDNYPSYAPTVM
ncbi:CRE-CLEC-85 protein [Caenorhabditis remanei]|uniref:CRE-CLEC-85 protein n=1 Tax=Caenorhabditis remanei TaxID=31234 RepID=E3NJW1_CAERE|nr:CRE-CLEC-85 protein [Caenorhabditis remanei]